MTLFFLRQGLAKLQGFDLPTRFGAVFHKYYFIFWSWLLYLSSRLKRGPYTIFKALRAFTFCQRTLEPPSLISPSNPLPWKVQRPKTGAFTDDLALLGNLRLDTLLRNSFKCHRDGMDAVYP